MGRCSGNNLQPSEVTGFKDGLSCLVEMQVCFMDFRKQLLSSVLSATPPPLSCSLSLSQFSIIRQTLVHNSQARRQFITATPPPASATSTAAVIIQRDAQQTGALVSEREIKGSWRDGGAKKTKVVGVKTMR